MTLRSFTTPVLAAVLALAVLGCGSSDTPSSDTASSDTASSDTASSGGEAGVVVLNEADIEFAQGMIAHHEQAIEMSEIALDPTVGAGAEVVDLATRIEAAQGSEIDLMTGWLTAAGESITMDMSDGHDMSSMAGMMSVEQMDALANSSGPEFDRMWLEMMIAHHEGAVSQAQTVLADGSNADVVLLAEQIIADQEAEIGEMRALLGG